MSKISQACSLETTTLNSMFNPKPKKKVALAKPASAFDAAYKAVAEHYADVKAPQAKLALLDVKLQHDKVVDSQEAKAQQFCDQTVRTVQQLTREHLQHLSFKQQHEIYTHLFPEQNNGDGKAAAPVDTDYCSAGVRLAGSDDAAEMQRTITDLNAIDVRTWVRQALLADVINVAATTLCVKLCVSVFNSCTRLAMYRKYLDHLIKETVAGEDRLLGQLSNSMFKVPLLRFAVQYVGPSIDYITETMDAVTKAASDDDEAVRRLSKLAERATECANFAQRGLINLLIVRTGLKIAAPYLKMHVAFAGFLGMRSLGSLDKLDATLNNPPWASSADVDGEFAGQGRECQPVQPDAPPRINGQSFLMQDHDRCWSFFVELCQSITTAANVTASACRTIGAGIDSSRPPNKVVLLPKKVLDKVIASVDGKKQVAIDQLLSTCAARTQPKSTPQSEVSAAKTA